jgi:hypothetical protein
MTKTFEPIELDQVKTYSLKGRKSKVNRSDFARPWNAGGSLGSFFDGLPGILAASDFKSVVSAIVDAHLSDKTIVLAMGAHVIKVGLNPIVIDLMRRGVISAVAMNGAGIIHDSELAMVGRTSEDVAEALTEGAFGMAQETSDFLNNAIKRSGAEGCGLGEAVGRSLIDEDFPYNEDSILVEGIKLGVPVTIHAAVGTDIIHIHPGFDAGMMGAASHRDFRLFASVVASLEGGVYMNVGSAVVLPEVFLKAITLVRNLGHKVDCFTAVNMDFIRQYRSMTNVVQRPTASGGAGYNLTGHHEIMFPLLAAAVLEGIAESQEQRA